MARSGADGADGSQWRGVMPLGLMWQMDVAA